MLVRYIDKSAASGSIGGQTASHNRGGQYIRQRVVPTNPNTSYQQTVRGNFALLVSYWGALTAAERAAWETYAANTPVYNRLGDQIYLTGQQMYVKCNALRLAGSLTVIDAAPTTFGLASLTPVVVIFSETLQKFTVTFEADDPWVGTDDAALLLFGSRPLSPATNFFRGPYRYGGLIAGDAMTPPTSPDANVDTPFAFVEGQRVAARAVVIMNDARPSAVQFVGPNLAVA
jgi:hypothetical protein